MPITVTINRSNENRRTANIVVKNLAVYNAF